MQKNQRGEKPISKRLSIVLNARTKHSRFENKVAPERAEALSLLKVEHDLQLSGALDIKPNLICYNSLIFNQLLGQFWSQGCSKCGSKAACGYEATVHCWKEVAKDEYDHITSVISAFARAGQAEHAETLLKVMYSDYLDGNDSAKLDVISFSIVLDAWSKSGSPESPHRAEAIIERMAQLHGSGALNAKPNNISYNSVINCWAKLGRTDAPDAVLKLLRYIKQQYRSGDKSLKLAIRLCSKHLSMRLSGLATQANRTKEMRDEMRMWEIQECVGKARCCNLL
jgi:pentatricopeptide repeat protein